MKRLYVFLIFIFSLIGNFTQSNAFTSNDFNDAIQLKNNDSILGILDELFKTKKYNKLINKANEFEFVLLKYRQIDSLLISKIRHKKGYAYYQLEDYQDAITDYNNAISMLPSIEKESNMHGTILFDRSYAEYYFNRRTEYYKSLKKSAIILGKQNNPDYDYLLDVYAELSYETKYLGYFEEAENYLQKGYDIIGSKKNKTPKDVLFNYYSISLYCTWKKEDKALKHLKDLEDLKKTKPFNKEETLMYATSLNLMADFYIVNLKMFNKNNALKKAEDYLNKAFKHLNTKNNKDNYLQFKFNYTKLLLEKEDLNATLKSVDELMNLSKNTDNRRAFFIAIKAKVFFKIKDKNKSKDALFQIVSSIHNDTISLQKDYSNFKPSSILHHSWLMIELADEFLEAFPKETTIVNQANKLYHLGLQQFKNCYWQSAFNKTNKDGYGKALFGILNTQTLNHNSSYKTSIINDIENIENRLAWKSFINNRTSANVAIPDSLRYNELQLKQAITLAKQKNDKDSYLKAKQELIRFNEYLNKHYPRVASFVYNDFNVEDFQKQLKQGQIVLRYKKFKNQFFVFIITNTSIKILPLVDSNSFVKKIENYTNSLSKKGNYKQLAKELYKVLIPININNYKSIVIIPDGILYHLPFETLLNNSDQFLIEKYNISYASHLVFINNSIVNKNNKENELYVFSPTYNTSLKTSLKGALKESKNISKIFKGKIFIGDKALKSNFINNAQEASLLHLAMHANLNNENPEMSYFSFTSNEENNKMYLEELYSLNLNAKLAVLSACNTGKSNLEKPEGAISLQRAFVFAGVPTTVSSLWEVPDVETSKLIVSFYENLNRGQKKDQALRNTKLDYLKTTDDELLKHPFYWAGFVISGDTTAIKTEPKIWRIGLGLITFLCVISLGIILYRNKK